MNILMTTDDNYILQAVVTIYSIAVSNKSNANIDVIILCSADLSINGRDRLKELENDFEFLSIDFYEVDPEDFALATSDYRVPIASYYRLICAKAVDVNKAVFLDSDIIVETDLTSLFLTDLQDNYIAGVYDLYPALHPNFALKYIHDYNHKDLKDYINCGILLMNLKKIRDDGIQEKLINGIAEKNLWVDQDVWNRECYGKIKLLDWRYNYTTRYSMDEFEYYCGKSEGSTEGFIYHFCGKYKTWDDHNLAYAEKWWDYAKRALNEHELKIFQDRAIDPGTRSDIYDIADKCKGKKKIAIVGYSDYSRRLERHLKRHISDLKVVFCDNSIEKRQLAILDERVYLPQELKDDIEIDLWINAVQKDRAKIHLQLKGMGIPLSKILHVYHEIE